MTVSKNVRQYPAPGHRMLLFRGDTVFFRLEPGTPEPGSGWLRTNIGAAHITKKEIIAEVDQSEAPMHHDWFDIPMEKAKEGGFELVLPLCEVGHFEAKAYFLPDANGQPVWPDGENISVNVEPAESVCGNIVYNAFIRQFGPNKRSRQKPQVDIDFENLDKDGYTVIPPSGTFRSFIRELDFIVEELGCRYIQLLPVNPTPTTYGRMGRYGSPYASQSFRLVDTAYAEFDLKATPMDQFIELVDAIHSRHARLILDIAINHTGWGARLHEMYPSWIKRDLEGKIEIPGAWGVLWEDLAKLDYSKKELWQFMAMVFLTWCSRGVDGFRCDAGYMIPKHAWRYIIARVRQQYPDTIFFLEGLGGKISVTRDLLNTANLNWAYSELFQSYDRGQIHHYLPEAEDIAATDGIMVHFAETHDNPRLAAVSNTYARMRTALCALLSNHGGFAFANGLEWFATEKIDVHDASPLNWGAKINQVDHIRRLNTIIKTHPAFFGKADLRFVEKEDGNYLAVLRTDASSKKSLLVLVNLDCSRGVTACWDRCFPGGTIDVCVDLISSRHFSFEKSGNCNRVALEPGQVLCLSLKKQDLRLIDSAEKRRLRVPLRIEEQRLKSKVLDVFRHFYGVSHAGGFDIDGQCARLTADPAEFCRGFNGAGAEPCVTPWRYPNDLNRQVMVPPGHFLLVWAPVYFEACMVESNRVTVIEKGIKSEGGKYFALFSPPEQKSSHRLRSLYLTIYGESADKKRGYVHESSFLLYLQSPETCSVNAAYERDALIKAPLTMLDTNGIGGACRASSWWGHLESKYDALLAANVNPDMPDNRWIMFTRCRGWLVYQDYSQPIRTECIVSLACADSGLMKWVYRIPAGLGLHVLLTVGIEMASGQNRIRMYFHRHLKNDDDQIDDAMPVRLILRPDVENRSFHETTKAYTGPEHFFPEAVYPKSEGFVFSPDGNHRLNVEMPGAGFIAEPEWNYMVHRPLEATRGMDPWSDLFSPGYFQGWIKGGKTLVIDASMDSGRVDGDVDSPLALPDFSLKKPPVPVPIADAMVRAMDHFIVARQGFNSVIAGYPWFLDWGRDSLIFCRGLVAAGKADTASDIIRLFGQFEKNGTLPNMICGTDARNRDTSDAPLWFIVACKDLVEKKGTEDFLGATCGKRTIRDILFSIVSGYAAGTANGVKADMDTGLVFSPSHFTWMDTNYPASTPRQGYPVEIQALWYASLSFLAKIDAPPGFSLPGAITLKDLADRTARSVEQYFFRPDDGFLSDCLHCGPGEVAANAVADDALRPNQLFAVTMRVIKEKRLCESILEACRELLVPGAIRSLADRPVDYRLEICHNEKILGDPFQPYRGRYHGDEDTCRKPAYHNGTAWAWVFPSFCEAWAMVYGDTGRKTAMAWLSSSTQLINAGCPGHVPEILDGDYPHVQRGCDAQAWSASELLRVWEKIKAV